MAITYAVLEVSWIHLTNNLKGGFLWLTLDLINLLFRLAYILFKI